MHPAFEVHENRLAGLHVGKLVKPETVKGDALRGKGKLVALLREYQRLDAEGVAEGEQAAFVNQRDDRVSAVRPVKYTADCLEYRGRAEALEIRLFETLGKHVQQRFDVGETCELAEVFAHQFAAQVRVVRDVAVVDHGDAERVVDVERLGVFDRAGSDGRIADLADAGVAGKATEVLRVEDTRDRAVALLQVERSVRREHSGRVLASVLKRQ